MNGTAVVRAKLGGVRAATRISLVVAAIIAVAGCGVSAPATTPPSTATPVAATPPASVALPTPTRSAASSAASTELARNVAYQITDALLQPDSLDVYGPSGAGPWPVVVMFHGTPSAVTKGFLVEYAQRVASNGFVAFVASWGHRPTFAPEPDPYAYAAAANAQVACALAYATEHARDYNGDPATLIVFGHSGGSNVGSVAAFEGAAPAAGCASSSAPGEIDAVVTWDGNWLLDPSFDAVLQANPRVFDLMTPFWRLEKRPDLPLVLLVSETPNADVQAPMAAKDVGPYVALRDRDGALARIVDQLHPFADGMISVSDMQSIFLDRLRKNGNPATVTVVPGSTHTYFARESWPVFLAAFDRALEAART